MQRASHVMLAPGTAIFAATSGPTVLTQAAAAANGTQCFGLAVLAVGESAFRLAQAAAEVEPAVLAEALCGTPHAVF